MNVLHELAYFVLYLAIGIMFVSLVEVLGGPTSSPSRLNLKEERDQRTAGVIVFIWPFALFMLMALYVSKTFGTFTIKLANLLCSLRDRLKKTVRRSSRKEGYSNNGQVPDTLKNPHNQGEVT